VVDLRYAIIERDFEIMDFGENGDMEFSFRCFLQAMDDRDIIQLQLNVPSKTHFFRSKVYVIIEIIDYFT
jgi:hypothetical protein